MLFFKQSFVAVGGSIKIIKNIQLEIIKLHNKLMSID